MKPSMIHRLALLAAFGLLASACQTTAPQAAAPKPPAFVEAACGGCHATEPPFRSPNPESPSFAAIANRPGLTQATLATWLSDAHNYPEQMDFTLTRDQTQAIADYMITLRRAGYVPEQ
jgi:mono/diheme cytochrome c family protein